MADLIERMYTIEVPKASGIDGFLTTIRKILGLSRVQAINIDLTRVTYKRFLSANEPDVPIEVDFTALMPSFVVRGSLLQELAEEEIAHVAIAKMFRMLSVRGFHPIAFASGPKSDFWSWYQTTTGIDLSDVKDFLYGVQFLEDPALPNEALFLCAGYTRGAALIDTRHAFKIPIPLQIQRPK